MFYFLNGGKDLEIRYYSTVREAYFKASNQLSIKLDVPDVIRYTVKYDANGGSGKICTDTEILGEYILLENDYTAPKGKQFKCWSVDGIEKNVGDKITVDSDIVIMALWEDIPENIKSNKSNYNKLIWIFISLILVVSACVSGVIIYNNYRISKRSKEVR